MPLTVNRGSIKAERVRAAMILRKKIDELERRFAKTVATRPKYVLARNAYGFRAREMRKIAQKSACQSQRRDPQRTRQRVPRLDRRSFIAPISMKICEPNFAVGPSLIAPAWAG